MNKRPAPTNAPPSAHPPRVPPASPPRTLRAFHRRVQHVPPAPPTARPPPRASHRLVQHVAPARSTPSSRPTSPESRPSAAATVGSPPSSGDAPRRRPRPLWRRTSSCRRSPPIHRSPSATSTTTSSGRSKTSTRRYRPSSQRRKTRTSATGRRRGASPSRSSRAPTRAIGPTSTGCTARRALLCADSAGSTVVSSRSRRSTWRPPPSSDLRGRSYGHSASHNHAQRPWRRPRAGRPTTAITRGRNPIHGHGERTGVTPTTSSHFNNRLRITATTLRHNTPPKRWTAPHSKTSLTSFVFFGLNRRRLPAAVSTLVVFSRTQLHSIMHTALDISLTASFSFFLPTNHHSPCRSVFHTPASSLLFKSKTSRSNVQFITSAFIFMKTYG